MTTETDEFWQGLWWLPDGDGRLRNASVRECATEIQRLRAEIADLRTSVIAFGGLWAVEHAKEHGLPPGHLHPTHYDILARAGARMDDFVRGEET